MAQKIFDIIPPGEKQEPRFKLEPVKVVKKNRQLFALMLLLAGFLLFALAYFFIEPRLTIEIWPHLTPLTFETRAEIPATELVAEESVWREFPASGSTEIKKKAEGMITVYNNYHLEQILVKGTRFWCFPAEDELREFKTKKWVSIPAGGSLEVEVVAAQPGQEYNIPPCTFSVPGLKGTARYTVVYGKSSSPMRGGEIRQAAVVTEEDLSSAKEILTPLALEKSRNSLANLISSGHYISAEGGGRQKIIKAGSEAKAGQPMKKFRYEVVAQTRSLVLKKSDLESFAKKYALKQLPQGKEIQASSLQLTYPTPQANLKEGKIELDLKITVNVYASLDRASLKKQVLGKKLEEMRQLLAQDSTIEKVKIHLWPFWAGQAPLDTGAIDIKLVI